VLALISGWLGFRRSPTTKSMDSAEQVETLRRERDDLVARLADSDARLRERSELLYVTQQQYSSEHFELQRCMRDLSTERLRNAGAYASLDTTMSRARELQARIAALKARLRRHEAVEDEHFDDAPIRIEQPRLADGEHGPEPS
jgi:chromosome segregation ATPase